MREIKFRAWDGEKMSDPDKWMSLTVPIKDASDMLSGGHPERKTCLMQYTGLKDKNGKEIYEGDVVSVLYTTGHQYRGEVIFRFGSFEVAQDRGEDGKHMAPFTFCQRDTFEVIGNVYDSPSSTYES